MNNEWQSTMDKLKAVSPAMAAVYEYAAESLDPDSNERLEKLLFEIIGNRKVFNSYLEGSFSPLEHTQELFELGVKVDELVNCPEGRLMAEGKPNDLLCEIIRMVPSRIVENMRGVLGLHSLVGEKQ